METKTRWNNRTVKDSLMSSYRFSSAEVPNDESFPHWTPTSQRVSLRTAVLSKLVVDHRLFSVQRYHVRACMPYHCGAARVLAHLAVSNMLLMTPLS